MPAERFISISISARSGEKIASKARLVTWSDQERHKRAIKVGVIGFGLAVAFVFIPLAHFVLVPLALISTPFIVRIVFKQKQQMPEQTIECPKCSKNFLFPSSTSLATSEILCDHCRSVLEVRVLE